MKKIFHTPSGMIERDLTIDELKIEAKRGNALAIKELIELKGGWNSLTSVQKEKVTKLLLHYEEEL